MKLFKKIFSVTITTLILATTVLPAMAIPMSPDKYFIDAATGQTFEYELTLMGNQDTEESVDLYIFPVGMIKSGLENDRTFYIPDPNDMSEPANWISLPTSMVSIPKGEDIKLTWTLNVSEAADCGTNLAGIMTSRFNPENLDSNDIGIKTNVVSQVHVNVLNRQDSICPENGVKLSLSEFKVDKKFKLFEYDNIPFYTLVANQGNLISREPQGYIEIIGFGEKVSIPFNEEMLDIYPNTSRVFSNVWLDTQYPREVNNVGDFFKQVIYQLSHLRIGKYTARLGITKNAEPQIVSEVSLWIIPWKLILMLVIIVVAPITINNILHRMRDEKSSKKS